MAEINKEFLGKRNEEILKLKDSSCKWGKELLEQIEQATELNSLALVYAPFVEHATEGDCPPCRSVLIQANKTARKAMEY